MTTQKVKDWGKMPEVSIITLPPARWRAAQRLRLQALLAEPSAFASSYEDELAFPDDVWIARLTSAQERDGNMTYFAEVDGELVGMAGAHWSNRSEMRHVAEVYGVYVSSEMRGRGIASRLMRRLLEELRSLDQFEKVSLTLNTEAGAALGLYQGLGFKIIGTSRRELKVAGQYHDLHIMALQLLQRQNSPS
ncbi:MAG: GNAT family N-acetyltransferase [Chloroflexi bacterium]|nr:GNAT family N-acetyltransferase [Chloroflexota bacterium]